MPNYCFYSNNMPEFLLGHRRRENYYVLGIIVNRNHYVNSSYRLVQLDKEYKIKIESINSCTKFCINN